MGSFARGFGTTLGSFAAIGVAIAGYIGGRELLAHFWPEDKEKTAEEEREHKLKTAKKLRETAAKLEESVN